MKAFDLTGRRFGRLTVVEPGEPTLKGALRWLCLCDCGRYVFVRTGSLNSGNTRSCGCLRREVQRFSNLTHGRSRTPEYETWKSMHARCKDRRHASWANYGGRGITVDPRWDRFEPFYADMGDKPSLDYTLERIDNNAPYGPENCRWATTAEQNQNSRHCRPLTFRGETLLQGQWARRIGLDPSTLSTRLKSGWTVERALTTPSGRRKQSSA